MYAMDHTTHFEHRIDARPTRRFRRRADMAWATRSTPTTSTPAAPDAGDREQPDGTPWPYPEFAD